MMQRTLLLGGTGFIGRHVVDVLRAQGHAVTVFHRGLSAGGRALPEGVREVRGARSADPASLAGLDPAAFDVVIDTSGYEVGPVRAAARHFAVVPRYVYVSTISVYRDLDARDESAPLADTSAITDETSLSLARYGVLKAACEEAVVAERGTAGALLLRLGRTVGPHDSDERFPWLLRRVAQGGWVSAPGEPEAPVQLVDARDVATFLVHAAIDRAHDERCQALNVIGDPMTMRDLYATIARVTGAAARLVWTDDAILTAHDVRPYSEMPFWLPRAFGAAIVPNERARAAGLASRPLEETVRDTWAWLAGDDGWAADASARAHRPLNIPAGVDAVRERSLLRDAVQVRAYEPRDQPAVAALIEGVLSEFGFASAVGGLERDLAAIATGYAGGGFWVAELGGEVVGTVAIRPKDAGRCELKRLYLRGDTRGLGVGQRLYEHAERFAREAGYAKIWLDSSRRFAAAHRLYERNGFVLVDRLDNDWEDNVYEKDLPAPGA